MARIVDEEVLDRELNPEQAAAAKKIDGPMLILAGAGSGKTRAITYKIAHLVSRHHVEPGRVLAVTFTNKAAREMTGRIQKLLDCDMRFPWMGTFHSVCLRLPSSDTATMPASFMRPISEICSPSIPFVAAPMGYTLQLSASLAFLRIPLITAALSATGFVLGMGQMDV